MLLVARRLVQLVEKLIDGDDGAAGRELGHPQAKQQWVPGDLLGRPGPGIGRPAAEEIVVAGLRGDDRLARRERRIRIPRLAKSLTGQDTTGTRSYSTPPARKS